MENKKYEIMEANMERLEKKLTRIKNKCERFGCEFHYEKIGEIFKDVCDDNGEWHLGVKFIVVEAWGKAILNNWEFVAEIEHTAAGNIISGYGKVEVPEKYYTTEVICEHCDSKRKRKNTYIVRNVETGEFKQVGKTCLKDFTNGLSAEAVASYIACFNELIVGETYNGNGYGTGYIETKEFMAYVAEVINKFGYVKRSEYENVRTTADRASEYYRVDRGGYNGPYMREYKERLLKEMSDVNFNPHTEENIKHAEEVLEWGRNHEEINNYFHNVVTACKLEYIAPKNQGILTSVFPAYDKNLEWEAQRREEELARLKELEAGKKSEFVGEISERINFAVESFKCITSFDTMFGMMWIYKFVDKNGNVFIWKTSKFIDEGKKIKTLTGTVKAHNEFRDVKQTELTRCKVA